MATKPSPKYKGSLILNTTDSIETYKQMESMGLVNQDEFYMVPDAKNFVSYDIEPTKDSPNLVTSGGIYNHYEKNLTDINKRVADVEKAAKEMTESYNNLDQELTIAINSAVDIVEGRVDSTINAEISRVDKDIANLDKITVDKIGDIKVTVRKNLNEGLIKESWLPCDGRNLNDKDYPEIFNLIGPKYEKYNIMNCPLTKIYKIKYLNGYWIACGYNSNGAAYAYTKELEKNNWNIKIVFSDYTTRLVSDVDYNNGIYAFTCFYKNNLNTKYLAIIKTSDLASDDFDIITEYTAPSDGYLSENIEICHNDETKQWGILFWYGLSANKCGPRISYGKELNSMTRLQLFDSFHSTGRAYNFRYEKGYWYFIIDKNRTAYFYSDFSKEPILQNFPVPAGSSSEEYIRSLKRIKDYWVSVGYTTDTNHQSWIFYKENLNDNWVTKEMPNIGASYDYTTYGCFFDNNKYIIISNKLKETELVPCIYFLNELSDSFSEPTQFGETLPIGCYYSDNKLIIYNNSYIYYTFGTHLPNLSINGVNYFIKVLEEEIAM